MGQRGKEVMPFNEWLVLYAKRTREASIISVRLMSATFIRAGDRE